MAMRSLDGQMISEEAIERFEGELRVFSAGDEKPSLSYFLDSLAARLNEEGEYMIADRSSLPLKLIARLEPPGDEVVNAPPADGDLSEHLAGTLYRVSDEYEAAIGRRPTLAELLATIRACVRILPSELLSGVEGMDVVALRAERV